MNECVLDSTGLNRLIEAAVECEQGLAALASAMEFAEYAAGGELFPSSRRLLLHYQAYCCLAQGHLVYLAQCFGECADTLARQGNRFFAIDRANALLLGARTPLTYESVVQPAQRFYRNVEQPGPYVHAVRLVEKISGVSATQAARYLENIPLSRMRCYADRWTGSAQAMVELLDACDAVVCVETQGGLRGDFINAVCGSMQRFLEQSRHTTAVLFAAAERAKATTIKLEGVTDAIRQVAVSEQGSLSESSRALTEELLRSRYLPAVSEGFISPATFLRPAPMVVDSVVGVLPSESELRPVSVGTDDVSTRRDGVALPQHGASSLSGGVADHRLASSNGNEFGSPVVEYAGKQQTDGVPQASAAHKPRYPGEIRPSLHDGNIVFSPAQASPAAVDSRPPTGEIRGAAGGTSLGGTAGVNPMSASPQALQSSLPGSSLSGSRVSLSHGSATGSADTPRARTGIWGMPAAVTRSSTERSGGHSPADYLISHRNTAEVIGERSGVIPAIIGRSTTTPMGQKASA